MSDYTKTTDFAAKDALPSGNPSKVVTGTEHDDEYNALEVAVNSKYDSTDRGAANGIASLDASALILPAELPEATEAAIGALEIATQAEAEALTADDKIITPSKANDIVEQLPGNGLAEEAGVLSVDLDELSTTAIDAADSVPFIDATDDGSKQSTVADLNSVLTQADLSDYDANENVDHTTVDVIAGVGLSGGGDISADRTLDVDISGLTELTGPTMSAADTFLVDDGDNGTTKKIKWQSILPRVVAASNMTIAADDANTIQANEGSTDYTITVEDIGTNPVEKGHQMALVCTGTGTITVAETAGVTVTSLDGNLVVKASGGGAYLAHLGSNEWILVGDLSS